MLSCTQEEERQRLVQVENEIGMLPIAREREVHPPAIERAPEQLTAEQRDAKKPEEWRICRRGKSQSAR